YAGALLPHLSAHRTRRGQGDPRLRLRPVARAAVRPPLPCLPARPLPVVAQTQRTEPAGQPRLSLVPGPGPPDDGVVDHPGPGLGGPGRCCDRGHPVIADTDPDAAT